MRLNYKYLLAGFALLLATTSCKKDVVEIPESNNPVFKIDGTFGASDFSLIAGDNNVFMETSTSRINGVNVYSGNLSDGNFSIELGIFEGDVDQPNSDILNVIEQSTDWAFNAGAGLVVLTKELFPNAALISNIQWTVNDIVQSASEVPLAEAGVYQVCAFVNFMDGSSGTLCNELIVGFERNSNFKVNHYVSQEGILSSWLGDVNGDVYETLWYLDDVLTGKHTDFEYEIDSTCHVLRADIKFTDGTFRSKAVLVDGSSNGHIIDDFSVFEFSDVSTVLRDYNWRISVEMDGIKHTSENANNANSSLQISEIEYYGLNSAGKKVYLIDCTVNANVQSILGGADIPISFNGKFGIEIDN